MPAVADPAKTTEAPKSIIGASAAPEWKEYVPDAAKSADENTALKTAHDATKPAPVAEAVKAATVFEPIEFAKAVKLPDGFAPVAEQVTEFESILNNPNLSRAQLAQALVDFQAKNLSALTSGLSEKGKTDWETLQTDWRALCQKDPVIGGDKLPLAEAAIGKLLDVYGDAETRAIYDLTGAGNHPAMVKFLVKVAAKLNEAGPTPPPTAVSVDGDIASRMFTSMKK